MFPRDLSLTCRQRFYLALYLCKQVAIDELVTKIKGRKILKASVLLELTKKANDPDIIAGPQKITLQCPLTMGRLKNPCRSTTCQHIQCFDVTSYLHLQEQASQWLCPVCNNLATFENLAIDEYVKDVLDHTREDTEAVIIEPDGHWRTESPEVPEPRRSRVLNAVSAISIKLDDDDIVALDDFSSPSGRNTLTPNRSMFGTPSLNGATANGSSSTPSGSRKRTAEVIDLTLDSDDEDDRAIVAPAPKRQYTAGAASITDWSKYPQAGADWNN